MTLKIISVLPRLEARAERTPQAERRSDSPSRGGDVLNLRAKSKAEVEMAPESAHELLGQTINLLGDTQPEELRSFHRVNGNRAADLLII